jgi:hypothetical protein
LESITTIYSENEVGSDDSDDDSNDDSDRDGDDGTVWTFNRDVVEEAQDDEESVVSDDTLRDEDTVDEECGSDDEGTVDDDDSDDGSSRHNTQYQATIFEYDSRSSWRDVDEEDQEDDSD